MFELIRVCQRKGKEKKTALRENLNSLQFSRYQEFMSFVLCLHECIFFGCTHQGSLLKLLAVSVSTLLKKEKKNEILMGKYPDSRRFLLCRRIREKCKDEKNYLETR